MSRQVFEVVLEKPDEYDSAYFHVPFDVHKVFGTRAQVKVAGTIDGVPYRSSIANMGSGHCMVVNKQLREATGKKAGDRVKVVMERDNEPRVVEVPQYMREFLVDEGLLEVFETLSYTHQKEYVESLETAKKEETRQSRMQKMIVQLKERRDKKKK